jgi:RNA polymerase sigma-70 factor (sigma-E family)
MDDDSSFREYVAVRGEDLARLAYLLTGNHSDADDLVQHALAKAYARWTRIGALDSPDAYVRRIMANQHVSWWRKRRREQLTEQVPEVLVADVASDHAIADLVRTEIRSLPSRQRAAIVFRYYDDLDDTAIAAALGCSVSTVRSQISRALRTLRGRVDLVGSHTPEVPHDVPR